MAEYIPNWKGLEAYSFTGSNQAEITTQAQKNGGSTFTDDKGNFYVVIDKTEYFLPPNYVLVINEKRAGKLYKKADFDAKYKDYSGGGSGTEITAGEGIKVSASGEVSADFDVLAKKEDLDKNVFVAVYNQTTAQELLDYLATTNKPYAPIIVERGGQYYTAILSFKQNDETAYIRLLGSASGEYTVFNHSIKGKVWGTETTTLQKKIDLSTYYTKTETNAKIAEAIAGFDKLDYKIVDTLPATGDAGVRYLVKIPRKKSFEEWIYIDNEWHNIGTTSDVNLDNYYTKTETEAWVNAQNYLKEHQDLSGYATEAWVNEQNFAKSVELVSYATQYWVNQGFVKINDLERSYYDRFQTEERIGEKTLYLGSSTAELEHPTTILIRNNNSTASITFAEIPEGIEVRSKYDGKELSFNNIQLVSKNYVDNAIPDTTNLATQSWVVAWVENKNYLTSHQDLSAYAKTADVNTALSLKADKTQLNGLATEGWVEAKNYLTEHQDLSGYATQTWVNSQNFLKTHQDISNLATKTEVSNKQDKLTAGEGIAIENNTISADIGSAFKFVQKNANGITIPANTRTNVIVADILETPYQIAGFRQIGILKGDGGDDIGWKNCVIQSYSTTNVGKSAQVQIRNTGATEAIINVSVNVLAFKTS